MGYREEEEELRMREYEAELASLSGTAPPPPAATPPLRAPLVEEPPAYDPITTVDQSEPAPPEVDVKAYLANKYGFGPGRDDAALARAEDRADRTRSISGYGKAFERIGSAIAGSKNDPSFYNDMQKNADAPIDTVMRGRKASTENIAMKKMGEENDADSPLAHGLRRTYGATLKRIGGDESILNDMSASQIKEYGAGPIDTQVKLSLADRAARAKVDAAGLLGSRKSDPKSATNRRAEIYGDTAGARAANDLHADPNIKKLASLYQNVARGNHNVSPTMTYQVAHEVIQDFAAALSGINATTDARIAGITPQLLDEKLAAAATFLESDPNRKVDHNMYLFLKDQGLRLKDGFQNSVTSEVKRKSAGKQYSNANTQKSFETARDHYTSGQYAKDTDDQFATTTNAKYDDKGEGGKKVVRKQHNEAQQKTKITYSDGTTEIVDGIQ